MKRNCNFFKKIVVGKKGTVNCFEGKLLVERETVNCGTQEHITNNIGHVYSLRVLKKKGIVTTWSNEPHLSITG